MSPASYRVELSFLPPPPGHRYALDVEYNEVDLPTEATGPLDLILYCTNRESAIADTTWPWFPR